MFVLKKNGHWDTGSEPKEDRFFRRDARFPSINRRHKHTAEWRYEARAAKKNKLHGWQPREDIDGRRRLLVTCIESRCRIPAGAFVRERASACTRFNCMLMPRVRAERESGSCCRAP